LKGEQKTKHCLVRQKVAIFVERSFIHHEEINKRIHVLTHPKCSLTEIYIHQYMLNHLDKKLFVEIKKQNSYDCHQSTL